MRDSGNENMHLCDLSRSNLVDDYLSFSMLASASYSLLVERNFLSLLRCVGPDALFSSPLV